MIVDRLERAELYYGMGDRIATALRWLQKHADEPLDEGKHTVRGETIYALVQNYEPKAAEDASIEAHRKYIDVQYVAKGIERMGWADVGTVQEKGAYDAEGEFQFYTGSTSWVTATAGTFMIFMPQDAHVPGVSTEGSGRVRKIVVKVAID